MAITAKIMQEKLSSKLSMLIQDTRGNFAIMAAVSLLPVLLCIGAAIDYTRVYLAHSSMTSALDAAVLSAAKGLSSGALSDDQVEDHINAMVAANLAGSGMSGIDFAVVNINNDGDNGKLSAGIQTDLPMAFMSLANIDTKTVGSAIEVTYGSQKVELTMMLDMSGSMLGDKIATLKVAAEDAVNILLPVNMQDPTKTRIGLVPYSYSVNAGNYADDVTDDESDECVTERDGDEAFTDASPINYPLGADPVSCPAKAIRPLTSQRDTLLNDISGFSAGGATAGHLGIAWSYYMLSAEWNNIWPTNSEAGAFDDDKILKVALLMTDGNFNTYHGSCCGNATQSNAAAIELCGNMRDKGITVYSIAFQAPLPAQQILQACATPDQVNEQHYYNAANGEQLKQAFAEIANRINTLRISQ